MSALRPFLFAVGLSLSFAGCVTQPPPPQTPQLSHNDEVAAFEAIIRFKLTQLPFPRGSTVYLDAREIFPNNYVGRASIQEVSRHITTHKIVLVPDERYPTDQWLQVYLNSTDGELFYFSVHDHRHANTFRLAKRDGKWIVIQIDPVIMT